MASLQPAITVEGENGKLSAEAELKQFQLQQLPPASDPGVCSEQTAAGTPAWRTARPRDERCAAAADGKGRTLPPPAEPHLSQLGLHTPGE